MSPTENIRKADARFAELEKRARILIENEESLEMDCHRLGAKELIHQLQVYQVELEIQNEELRDTQEKLLISRDHLSHLYHQAPVGYISVDKYGIIREVNQRWLNMLQMTIDECMGKPLVDFICEPDRSVFLGRFRAFFKVPEGKSMEVCLKREDGSVFYARLEGRLAEPTHDLRAKVKDKVYMLLTISDITARREAEANLRLADKIIHTAQEAILVTDPQGTVLNVNPSFEKATGYAKDEIIGKNPRILQSGRQSRSFYEAMWEKLADTGNWQGIVWNRRKSGEEYAEKLTINAIYGERREITHYVGVFTDITDQLELEERLRQSQKMEAIGTLVGGIAHDFNNMLAGIVGNLYLAKKKSAPQTAVLPHIEAIETLSDRAAQMITQMLTFARKGIVQMQPLSLNSCVDDILAAVGRVTIPENIQLNIDLCREELIVNADKTQIQQVIINLLSNARDALADREQPVIDICLTSYRANQEFLLEHGLSGPEAFARLTVTDNGCGIENEKYAHIFEPFFTTKETGKGTGLGLAMVYGAVQTHGGVIKLESKQGAGTSFHLFLPVTDAAVETQSSEPLTHIAGKGETILLVDDEDVVRSVSSEVLENHGYQVIQADDGKVAMDIFEARLFEIDLIILDIVMPNMNGDEVAQNIRQRRPDIPIIFMTGYDKEHVISRTEQLKNSMILGKPFQYEELSHMLRRLLD